jgi:hypothetical protein
MATAEDPPPAPDGGGQDQGLTARVDGLEKKIDDVLEAIRGRKDPPAGPGPADQPGSVADEIARALDERDAREKATRDKADGESRIKGLEDKIAGLAEQPPEPPVRKVESFMKWR